jgi:hypothetical protein
MGGCKGQDILFSSRIRVDPGVVSQLIFKSIVYVSNNTPHLEDERKFRRLFH